MAARILGGDAAAAAEAAGIAETLTCLLQSLPIHAARNQLYLPLDILGRYDVAPDQLLAGQATAGLKQALADLRALARRHLAVLGERMSALPPAVIPTFLSLAPVRASLDRLEHSDPFAPGAISPWRRQWLIWRASRNPGRIAC
jgi:phytoene synthase